MPRVILRAAPDEDLYCLWSTVASGPTDIGTKDEILTREYTRLHAQHPAKPSPGETPQDQLDRAEQTGTSARWPDETNPYGGWAEPVLIVDHDTILRREDLGAYLHACLAGDDAAANALLIAAGPTR